MNQIVVSEKIVGPAMEAMQAGNDVLFAPDLWKSPDELKAILSNAAAIIVRNQTEITADLIASSPQLKVIGRAGAGLDNIDLKAAKDAGVIVTFTPHENSISVAELALGLMLDMARHISCAVHDTREGGWGRQKFTGIELSGKTLGIVGFGRIGRMVAERAKPFGMKIIAHDDFIDPQSEEVKNLDAKMMSLNELLSQSDFVSTHVPLLPETKHLFSYDRFCQMKPTAFFLNTSRGGVVHEAGLTKALEEKQIAGAALDVRETEPPTANPLSKMKNVILTPHIAAFTEEAQVRVVTTVCRDVVTVLGGGTSTNQYQG